MPAAVVLQFEQWFFKQFHRIAKLTTSFVVSMRMEHHLNWTDFHYILFQYFPKLQILQK